MIDRNYTRIIPRDLFNEAKLLKCMGRLILLIHNGTTPVTMHFDHSGESFEIGQLPSGEIAILNIDIFIEGGECIFKTFLNAKANYPLYLEHEEVDYLVFDEEGKWDSDFINFTQTIINK